MEAGEKGNRDKDDDGLFAVTDFELWAKRSVSVCSRRMSGLAVSAVDEAESLG